VPVVATAGHVDHGKSTLVHALTGIDPDRWAEEKERGLTIDLGFAWCALPGAGDVAFVDVPGHARFISNMLAGVGAVDACLFVVAATEGWKPQSEEHLRILDLLGVPGGVVALTMAALVDADALDLARLEVAERLAGTFLESAPIVAVDAPAGIGLDALAATLGAVVGAAQASVDRGRPRLWVDRSFAARGAGTVVTGTLTGGSLAVDDELVAEPAGIAVRVRGLQSYQHAHDTIGPGSRVAVNLVGVGHAQVGRGDALVRPGQWWRASTIDCTFTAVPRLGHPVSRRGAFHAHIGAGQHAVKVRVLGDDHIEAGATGLVRIHLPTPLPLLRGDRYVLRESGRGETVGGGEVLDVDPVLPAAKARPDQSVDRLVAERGWTATDDLERLTGERRAADAGHWVVAPAALAAATERLRGLLAAGEIDVATLDARDTAVLATLDGVVVQHGRARSAAASTTDWSAHHYLAALAAAPFAPPEPHGVDRDEVRELVRRGLVVERDGCYFAASAIDAARQRLAALLDATPAGITVGAVRDALATTRKHAIPLLAHLDATGVTRRRGDLRVAGPRLRPQGGE
jgi:selenocysteine-specific elongation factor